MKPYRILTGDCLQTLRTLPKKSVQCVITSPPYFGLRDYGVEGQIGQEPHPEAYVANLVKVFREVRRVLRDDGTLWLNIGDTMREKQLLGIPWLLAFAMKADGWLLRSEVIWHKRSPMPEAVTDRPTRAHEQVFLFAKQGRYFYDGEAIKEKALTSGSATYGKRNNTDRRDGGRYDSMIRETSNKRSVWSLSSEVLKDAHFAMFPIKLIMPMILAGTSEKGCCPRCHAPYRRLVEKVRKATRPAKDSKLNDVHAKRKLNNTPGRSPVSLKTTLGIIVGNRDPERHVTQTKTVGWEPTCDCNAGEPVPCVVLDLFGGAMTTLVAAVRRNRHAIGCELNPEYVKIGLRRINKALRKKGFGLI